MVFPHPLLLHLLLVHHLEEVPGVAVDMIVQIHFVDEKYTNVISQDVRKYIQRVHI
jgi:hypothetical protein